MDIYYKQHTGFGASIEPCDISTELIRANMVSLPGALLALPVVPPVFPEYSGKEESLYHIIPIKRTVWS